MKNKDITIKNTIGKRIRQIRDQIGLNQNDLAEHMGCGRSNISLIENGKNFPSGNILIALKSKYNVSLDWLFSGQGPMFIEAENDLNLLDFMENSDEVKQMLADMKNNRIVMHRVLSDYLAYIVVSRQTAKKKRANDNSNNNEG
jgi:transcriptional regulator with XRE-family HTH domain